MGVGYGTVAALEFTGVGWAVNKAYKTATLAKVLAQVALQGTKNPSSTTVLLGKGGFVEAAKAMKATYYDLNPNYHTMKAKLIEVFGKENIMTLANLKFLDQQIAAGKKIYSCTHPALAAGLKGKFGDEIAYLAKLGYTKYKEISPGLWEIVKP